MLKVGLDLRATEPDFKAHFGRGTGRYALELSRSLLRQERCLVAPLSREILGGSRWEQAIVRAVPFGRQTIETQLLLPFRLAKLGLDFIHFVSHGDAPAWGKLPSIVTVLDLIPLRFAELYKADRPFWHYHVVRSLERRAMQNARGFIAISDATKRDMVELLGIDTDRIVVTPLAVGDEFAPIEEEKKAEVRRDVGVPSDRPLLLYVGGIDPRKNVLFMLEVFAEVVRARQDRPLLVFVGTYEKDRHFPKLLETVRRLGLEEHVFWRGFVSDEELPKLYQSAELTLFPSLYEGFGFPVLEALASGVVVLAGRNSSLPEVVGDDYPLLPDSSKSAWVTAILALLENPAERRTRIERGLQRARQFSWEKTAEQTVAAYEYFAARERRC